MPRKVDPTNQYSDWIFNRVKFLSSTQCDNSDPHRWRIGEIGRNSYLLYSHSYHTTLTLLSQFSTQIPLKSHKSECCLVSNECEWCSDDLKPIKTQMTKNRKTMIYKLIPQTLRRGLEEKISADAEIFYFTICWTFSSKIPWSIKSTNDAFCSCFIALSQVSIQLAFGKI